MVAFLSNSNFGAVGRLGELLYGVAVREFPQSLTSLAEITRWRAEEHPTREAFTFLADGEKVTTVLTFAELDQRARAIAGVLQDRTLNAPVLLCFPSGPDYVAAFLGCLYAGAIAIPAYPPRNRRHVSRIQAIAADSRASLALSAGSSVDEMRAWLPKAGETGHIEVIDAQQVAADAAALWKPITVRADDLAYLQYTSGSTSTPKGVMVGHENLLRNADGIRDRIALDPGSVTVSWLPLFHDMGLVLTLVAPVITGTPVVMMPPAAFVQRPLRWLDAVSRFRATHSGGPNFSFELLVDRTTPAQRQQLDLSRWTTSYTGSEPVRKSTLERFSSAFAVSGFSPRAHVPVYGLAEATLLVTTKRPGEEVQTRSLRNDGLQNHRVTIAAPGESGAIDIVSCGNVLLDTTVALVDPQTRLRVPPGGVGEVWVQAPGVALGYWKNQQATDEVFGARLAENDEGPFLRTGDLGFSDGGQLYITGRIKDVVILRGRNHYPHDIELTVQESHASLARDKGAVFGVPVDNQERLVVVQEVSRTAIRGLHAQATLEAVRQAVAAEHEIEIYDLLLVAPLEVPRTSSGKIQRSVARQRYLAETFQVVARWCAPTRSAAPAGPEASRAFDGGQQRAIEHWLIARLAALRSVALAEIDVARPFVFFGIDSITAVRLSGELEEWLNKPLPPTLLYDYPDIRSLSRQLAGLDPALVTATPGEVQEPIAIVGVGCRIPGAATPDEFWEMLRRGADLVSEVPVGRWGPGSVSVGAPGTPGHVSSLRGGFVGDVALFDAEFFGISPREAVEIDPQQRMLLEVAWSALEDAGIAPSKLAGTDTGVFVGVSTRDYADLLSNAGASGMGPYFGTGTAASGAAGRLSYVLGLEGPSLAVDTACSSSLVAIHLASQSLRSGECRTALVGGVNLVLSSNFSVALSQARMLSPTGHCRTFDAGADGYVRGEGCGVVVLKRLRDALADGNRIHAVVRGTAVNNDGRTNGLTAPSARAQERVIRAALRAAGVKSEEVGYIEAHGTGTPLGDPIEVQALARVFGERHASREPAYLGSVKTNIGHLEAAAGIAGLIKVVLSLRHGEIPPHLHLDHPNPIIAWDRLPFQVPRDAAGWPADRSRRIAGISSFGFVGTNAHVVLEAAPARADRESPGAVPHLLCLSARTPTALDELAGRYVKLLGGISEQAVRDVCASTATGRNHMRHRLALLADSKAELQGALDSARRREPKRSGRVAREYRNLPASPGGAPGIVFLCTGQGSQYADMAKRLYLSEPGFRRALDRCAEVLQPHMSVPLLSILHPGNAADRRIDQTEFSQPALFAIEWSLAEMWSAWGVTPSALIGHSIGEYAAACIAGVFGLEDAAALVAARGRAMQKLPAGGAMFAVAAEERTVMQAIGSDDAAVCLAAVNAPSQCVISGAAAAVARVVAQLETEGVGCEPLNVSHAFHSTLMRPALEEIDRALVGVHFQPPRIPIFANLYGREAAPGEIESPDYWRRQVTDTVRFGDCVTGALERGFLTFLEIGPQPTLTALAQRVSGAGDRTWAASLRRHTDDRRQITEAQAALYVAGVDIDWDAVYGETIPTTVSLPGYPFQRQRYWADVAGRSGQQSLSMAANGRHTLLGERLPLGSPDERAWLRRVDRASVPWLSDHQVDGALVYPGMGFVEAASVAASEILGADAVELSDVAFERPLVSQPSVPFDLQTHVTREGAVAAVAIYSRASGVDSEWVRHCVMRASALTVSREVSAPETVETIAARCAQEVTPLAFYERWGARGNQWSGTFRGIEQLLVGDREAIARIVAPAAIVAARDEHRAHPAILDACVQALAAVVGDSRPGAFVGKAIGAIRLHAFGKGPLWSHAVLRDGQASRSRTIHGDVRVYLQDGRIAAEMVDVQFEFIDFAAACAPARERWLHVTEWVEAEPPASGATAGAAPTWVVVHTAADASAAGALAGALAGRGHSSRIVSVGDGVDSADGATGQLVEMIAVARQLTAPGVAPRTRMVILTRAAWTLSGDAPAASAYGSVAWGLARTLAAEHRELGVLLIDLDPVLPEVGIDTIAEQMCSGSTEDELAARGTKVFVPRLVDANLRRAVAPRLRPDQTYVVTGGLGTLGLRVARWLADRGCRHLVLMGRTPLPPRMQWRELDPAGAMGRRVAAVLAIEALGASVRTVAVDVTDEAALASWLAGHRREMSPAIRGVIHAAGTLTMAPSLELTNEGLRDHLAAKTFGARALDRLFAADELDAFVLFSSASAVLGSPGLAAYAAANSGLDALATARRARGGRAISIQWGAWAGGGMARVAIDESHGARAAETIDPELGLRVLGELWDAPVPVMAVLPIDWNDWGERNAATARAPYFSRLMRPHASSDDAPERAELAASDPADRRARLTRWIAHQTCEVLRIPEAMIELHLPLNAVGLDSLMALEIRNRVQNGLQVAIPLVELIRGATITQIVQMIEDRLGEGRSGASLVAVPRTEIAARPWPLSHGQQAQWLLHSMRPDSASYHVAFAARVCSPVNVTAMQRAWRALRERHATLRTQWSRDGSHLVQQVRTSFVDSFETSLIKDDEAVLEQETLAAYRRPFDLQDGEPARLHLLTRSGSDHVLLLVAHHIACDGWSLWILIEELKQLYAAECGARSARLAPQTHSYVDFINWELALLRGPECDRQWEYWRARLSGELPALELPTDRPRARIASGRGSSHAFTFPADLRDALARLAQDRGVTLFTVLAAGLGVLLQRYTGQHDILIGMPAAGRTENAFAGVVGHFVNQVVLRLDLSGEPTFNTMIDRAREAVLGAMAAENLPFPVIVHRLSPDRDAGRSPLFQVNLVYQQAQQAGEIINLMTGTGSMAPVEWGGLLLRPYRLAQQEGQFDLTVEVMEAGATLSALLKYDSDLFDAATIVGLGERFKILLASAQQNPDRTVGDLEVFDADDRARLISEQGRETAAWPPACLHRRFEEAARRAPDAVALICEGQHVSYGELNGRANRLAARLRRKGVGPETLVALLFDPRIEMVVAILGALKAGGAFLPLDAAAPDDRLAFMLEDSGAAVLVTGRDRGDRLSEYGGTVLDLDAIEAEVAGDVEDCIDDAASPANAAYCIYTSGTTGRPKGVVVEHRQVCRLFDATREWFSFDTRDVWTLFHSYAFDFSCWEIWGALLHGGRLVIVPRPIVRAPEAFHALVAEHGVTVLNQTPSAFREFVAADERTPVNALSALRLVIFGGEALDLGMLSPWIARHGAVPRLVNMYGITETTVHVTYAEVDSAMAEGPSRIGVPIPDLQVYLLDARMQPVPDGVRGELYVGGAGLARGYLGRAALTAERFVPHPFSLEPGARLYRTGDLARYRAGTLEYLGRIDGQVKIRGFRIERGEIEAVLRAFPGVRDAIVAARQGVGGDNALFAYVLREAGASPGVASIRSHLRATLPEYMVPATIHILDSFPLTANGKVDDHALATLGATPMPQELPSNATERMVATIWCEVLGIEKVGLHDNFFDLGGHSLLVPRVHRRLKEHFDTTLSLVELFRHSTVADLAGQLENLDAGSGSLDDSEKRAQIRQARRGTRARGRVTL
ncbi:MAG TPA: amino acid adenylation domain-containing protein [Bradyrhizobium sp.]|nr:amino acid adenylation domain-containing protein [Bradyrhizobium sp.]